jgi:hypothetical protein
MELTVWAPFAGRGAPRPLAGALRPDGATLSADALRGIVAEKLFAVGIAHGQKVLARVAAVQTDRTVAVDLREGGRRIPEAAVRVPEATWTSAALASEAALKFLEQRGYRVFAGPFILFSKAKERGNAQYVGGVDALAEDREATVLVELFTTSRVAARFTVKSSTDHPLLKRMGAKAQKSLTALRAADPGRLPPAAQLASVLLVLTVEVERNCGTAPLRVSAERYYIRGSGNKQWIELDRRVVRWQQERGFPSYCSIRWSCGPSRPPCAVFAFLGASRLILCEVWTVSDAYGRYALARPRPRLRRR